MIIAPFVFAHVSNKTISSIQCEILIVNQSFHHIQEECNPTFWPIHHTDLTEDHQEHPKGRKMVSLGDVMSRGPKSIETMVFFLKHRHLMYMIDSNHGWKIARWLDGRKVQLKHGDEKVEEEFIEFERKNGKEKTVQLKKELRDMLINLPSHYILSEKGQPKLVCVHA